MTFLDNDEFHLLMDIAVQGPDDPAEYSPLPVKRYSHISIDDLKMLRETGIKTTMPFQCIWNEIEKVQGEYDWSYLDNYIANAREAGMKVILFTPTGGYPEWFPDHYFARCEDGVHREALSLWNLEAQHSHARFVSKMADHVRADDVMIVSSQLGCGETVYLNKPAFYDPAAIESFKEFVGEDRVPDKNDPDTNTWLLESYKKVLLRQQTILTELQDHGEIFVMLHPAIGDMSGLYGNGCNWITEILSHLHDNLPDIQINHIYYTWVQWKQYWSLMNGWRSMFNENAFGGAEYCEGLPTTTPLAIENGLRGLIVAPCYPNIHDHVEPWMLENIKNSVSLFKQAKGIL